MKIERKKKKKVTTQTETKIKKMLVVLYGNKP